MGVVTFSNVYGILGKTEKAEEQVEVRQESCIMPKKPAAGDWMLIAECIEKTEK